MLICLYIDNCFSPPPFFVVAKLSRLKKREGRPVTQYSCHRDCVVCRGEISATWSFDAKIYQPMLIF